MAQTASGVSIFIVDIWGDQRAYYPVGGGSEAPPTGNFSIVKKGNFCSKK
jgi:hypothetical protein